MNGGVPRSPGPDEKPCPYCNGVGHVAYDNHVIECWRCHGTGVVRIQKDAEPAKG